MAVSSKTFSVPGTAGLVLLLLGADGGGCGSSATPPVDRGTTIRFDLGASSDFYASPFPSEHRRKADGHIGLDGFPNPENIGLVSQIVDIVERDADGFGTTSGVFFTVTSALDPKSLPDMRTTLTPTSSVLLMSVDAKAVDRGVRYPVDVSFMEDGGPFGAPNLLALLPYQGVPLRPGTLYAAVVTRAVRDTSGAELGMSAEIEELTRGRTPTGMSEQVASLYRAALSELEASGIARAEIAGLAVFRTGNPTDTFVKVTEHALSQPLPEPTKPFEPAEVFDNFCVFETTIKIPTYQAGVPPYTSEGGGWTFDAAGDPIVQAEEEANFVITLPRAPMPEAGFPVVIFSRTGAGGERPLVDRGVRETPGGEAKVPGTGPAFEFAKVGFAGSTIDGPHGGLRNVSASDEQFLVFNVFNPLALRDNVRESAVELVLQAHILESIEIDAASCPGLTTPGGQPAKLDVQTVATFGHSMGASILPLSIAVEPRLRGAILSGAGSSYIANIIHKQKPLATNGFAKVLLEYPKDLPLTEFDPVMSLLQWAAEPADTQAYGRSILREAKEGSVHHIMMVEGVVDRYILPPIANSTALSLGLDLGGQELDTGSAELAPFAPLASVLDLGDRSAIDLPAQGNVSLPGGATATAVVVQHAEDGVEDGHEAVFQSEEPKHQYRCFLQSLAKGTPRIPTGQKGDGPCE